MCDVGDKCVLDEYYVGGKCVLDEDYVGDKCVLEEGGDSSLPLLPQA